MTDNLTNRIAQVIAAHELFVDTRYGKGNYFYFCGCGPDFSYLSDHQAHVAAAIVEELGLRRANKVRSYGLGPNGVVDRACHRYVTEWEADE